MTAEIAVLGDRSDIIAASPILRVPPGSTRTAYALGDKPADPSNSKYEIWFGGVLSFIDYNARPRTGLDWISGRSSLES